MKFHIALALGSVVAGRILPECYDKVLVRKDIREMSEGEANRYFNAVKKLNSRSRLDRWDLYAGTQHRYPNIQDPPLYLAWNRMILYAVEKDLQKIDSNVTIPYWDWTAYSNHPDSDPIFLNPNIQTSCIKGETSSHHQSSKQNRKCFTRKHAFQAFSACVAGIDKNNLRLNSITSLAETMKDTSQGNASDRISSYSHGSMSPRSLLLYSQHAFIDKLWFDWQNHPTDNYDDYHTSLNRKLKPWNVPIRKIIDPVSSLCYKYARNSFKSPKDLETPHHNSQEIKLPESLPEEIISRNRLDFVKIRQQELKDAILLAKLGPS
ncbi:hypothetical protein DSO57_1029978 [Entomophthora muscae]|uniref:Uncharacterized protein n=1 Tax=Entomophthora muscae TaxID=34485 RepID=A0ACC2UAP5_9FUNG|nr:hypothetical protein DSO57_1029978 [Entomophthora muscae]